MVMWYLLNLQWAGYQYIMIFLGAKLQKISWLLLRNSLRWQMVFIVELVEVDSIRGNPLRRPRYLFTSSWITDPASQIAGTIKRLRCCNLIELRGTTPFLARQMQRHIYIIYLFCVLHCFSRASAGETVCDLKTHSFLYSQIEVLHHPSVARHIHSCGAKNYCYSWRNGLIHCTPFLKRARARAYSLICRRRATL